MPTLRLRIQLAGLYRAYGVLRRFLLPYWKAVAFVIVMNIFIGTMISARPLLLAPALDVFQKNREEPAKHLSDLTLSNIGPTLMSTFHMNSDNVLQLGITIGVLMVLLTMVIAAMTIVVQIYLIRTRARVVRDMTTALHRHLLTLTLSFFHRHKTGDIVSRITYDARRVAGFLDKIVQSFLKSGAQVFITLFILFRTDAVFTIVVIGIGLLHLVTNRLLGWRVKKRSHHVAEVTGDMGAKLQETFNGIKTVKMFAAERYDAKQTWEKAQNLTESTIKYSMTSFYQQPIRMVIDAIMASAVLIMVFYAVTTDRMTLTAAALFFYLARQLVAPLSDLFSQGIALQNMLGAAERIFEIFDTKSEIEDGSRNVLPLQDRIELRDITFSYPDGTRAIDDISLRVEKGEFVGLVGMSGGGKTTLTDLVLRLYDCQTGGVYFDGVDIREFRQREYRKQFGIVGQDTILFNASVRDNVVFNKPFDEEQLRYALWVANATEFVATLSAGIDTQLGDRGVRLSGGQRQRIAIARAIYGKPSILILDEATSALDTESERQVQKAIDRISKEMTMIVVAHRLSTVRHADKIVVLNKGRIEGVGSHDVLLAESPIYKKLVQLQNAGQPAAAMLS